jgi:DNA invertase Pin-like site-specific DNA recombinase
MKIALYARVSTKDRGQDTENQLAQLRAFADTQGWTVVHEYVDRATGKHSDREQFQKMFEDASQRGRIAQMDEEGFTLREIAEEMGISSATACRILKGYRRPQNPAAGL